MCSVNDVHKIYMCNICVPGTWGNQNPLDLSYGWLWAIIWVLGIKNAGVRQEQGLLTTEPTIFPALDWLLNFKQFCCLSLLSAGIMGISHNAQTRSASQFHKRRWTGGKHPPQILFCLVVAIMMWSHKSRDKGMKSCHDGMFRHQLLSWLTLVAPT